VEAEHVVHANAGQGGAEEVGPLGDARADEQPPLEWPSIASFGVTVTLLAMSHSAAAMKSSKTFCLSSFVPALCHASPYSPPPRRLATASTPPRSIHGRLLGLK
jgi:hypothetical protein